MEDFVTLAQVKTNLGITDSSDDTRLWAILDWVLEEIWRRIWDISQWDKTERVNKKMRMLKDDLLPFSIYPVTAIKTIDQTDFTTKVEGSDYVLLDNWTAEVKNLLNYVDSDFETFSITYTAWYANAPADFINIVSTIVGLDFIQDMWKDSIEETTGPRTVKFADPSRFWGVPNILRVAQFKKLKKYIPLHLRVY